MLDQYLKINTVIVVNYYTYTSKLSHSISQQKL